MHRQKLIVTIFILLLFYSLPSITAQIDPNSKEFVAAIDSIFSDHADLTSPGASVIIMKGEDLILSKNYGSSNLSFSVPFNNNTVFPLPNFTEQLVAFSILQLEQKGLINLADPVKKHLPEFGFEDEVSLSHLLNHSSDLPAIASVRLMAGWNFTDPFYQHDFLNLTKKITSGLKPDTNFNHNHSGIKILQMVVEKISGMNFSEYASANIFLPLDMTNSAIKNENFKETKNNSLGYNKTDAGFQRTYSTEYAAMCLTTYSTLRDFEKWMLNVQTKKYEGGIIEKMDQALMVKGEFLERVNRAYCVGQQQYYTFLGEDEYYFMDSNDGHSWKWIRLKQSDLSIMAITNLNSSMSSKVNAIARIMIPSNPEPSDIENIEPTPIKLTKKEMQTYTGFFWDSKYLFTTQISIKDEDLYYTDLHNGWNFPLTPLTKSLFDSPPWYKVEITNLKGQKKLNLILSDGREFPSEGYDPEIIDPKDYVRFTGTYFSDQLSSFFKVVLKDNKLILKRSRKPDLNLIPIGQNKFRAEEIDFRVIEFQEDDEKSIYKMSISNTLVKNVMFQKI